MVSSVFVVGNIVHIEKAGRFESDLCYNFLVGQISMFGLREQPYFPALNIVAAVLLKRRYQSRLQLL
jgi:hypothetical protein